MTLYKNDTQYTGTFAGIECRFMLHGFTPEVADVFNKELAEAGRRAYEEGNLSVEKNRPITN